MAESQFSVKVKAEVDKYIRDIRKAQKQTGMFSKGLGDVSVKSALAAVGIALVVRELKQAAQALIRSTLNQRHYIDALGKTAAKLNVTVQNLQIMRHAATKAGIGVQQLEMGLQRMTRRVSEAAIGTGEAQAALKEMRLDAKELSRLDPAKQFEAIAEAISRAPEENRIRLAMKIFDSEGVQNVLLSADAIRATREQLERLGILLDGRQVKSVEEMNDAWNDFVFVLRQMQRVFLAEIAPVLKRMLTGFVNQEDAVKNLGDQIISMSRSVAESIGDIAASWHDVLAVIKEVQAAFVMLDAEWLKYKAEASVGFFGSSTRKMPKIDPETGEVIGHETVTANYDLDIMDDAARREERAGDLMLEAADHARKAERARNAFARFWTAWQKLIAKRNAEPNPTAPGFRPEEKPGSGAGSVENETEKYLEALRKAEAAAQSAEGAFASFFTSFLTGAKSASEAARQLARSIAELVIQRAIAEPLAESIATGLNFDGIFKSLSGVKGSARGNMLVPFASGGVVDGPTVFPMRGATGLMGEAGPEAILPLQRDARGRLGVMGGGSSLIVNITTKDAESFRRYSRRQMKQDLQRVMNE